MAVVPCTVTPLLTANDKFGNSLSWGPLTTTNTSGDPQTFFWASDRSVQVEGTFGAGTPALLLEGSNDGVNYRTLHDPQGNAISISAAGVVQVLQFSKFVRPRLTGGDGTTSLTVTLAGRRTNP